MIKNLESLQAKSKHSEFAKALCRALVAQNIKISPTVLANEFNKQFESEDISLGTARNWLIGASKPRKPVLAKLSTWLNLAPESSEVNKQLTKAQKLSYTFDFKDQEVIAKYLAMTAKQKATVQLLIDAIADKKG